MKKVPPPPPRLPDPPQSVAKDAKGALDVLPLLKYLRDLREALNRELRVRSPDTVARGNLLLISPDGSVYEIVVSDAGVLTTNLLSS